MEVIAQEVSADAGEEDNALHAGKRRSHGVQEHYMGGTYNKKALVRERRT